MSNDDLLAKLLNEELLDCGLMADDDPSKLKAVEKHVEQEGYETAKSSGDKHQAVASTGNTTQQYGDLVMRDKINGDLIMRDKIIHINLGTAKVPRIPRQSPTTLPDNFVRRSEEYEYLVRQLTNRKHTGRNAACVALHGAGGYGKTTLATDVCQNEEVRRTYPDGTLWVTIGENPGSIPEIVSKLIFALTDEQPALRTEEDAAAALDTALGNRACLLVIDDVWRLEHLRPFLHGGLHCTRLITTRIANVLPRDTTTVVVDAMNDSEALELLCEKSAVTTEQQTRLSKLSSRLGSWPLLLGLVAGTLRDYVDKQSMTLHAALTIVEQSLDAQGLTAFDPTDDEARRRTVAGTLATSMEWLPERVRACHAELAIFPEDFAIPLNVIAMLWYHAKGIDQSDAEELCLRLVGLSLLQRYDKDTRTVHLHDVIRKYLVDIHQGKLTSWHAALLDAYRPKLSRAGNNSSQELHSAWVALPDEATYMWEHLSFHFEGAGQIEEFVAAVLDVRYLLAEMRVRGVPAVENDLRRALYFSPTHPQLEALERQVRLHSHLLRNCRDDQERATHLLSYFEHEIVLRQQTIVLRNIVPLPYFVPLHRPDDDGDSALIRTFSRCSSKIRSVAFSPDGRVALAGQFNGALQLWDVASGRALATGQGHNGAVMSLAFSPDGGRVLSGGVDQVLRLWDIKSGGLLHTFEGHDGIIWSVAFSPDGRLALSGGDGKIVHLWDVDGRVGLRTFEGHTDRVRSVRFSPDGRSALSGGDDKTVRLWDIKSGTALHVFEGHLDGILSVAFTRDSSIVISGDGYGYFQLWDVTNSVVLRTWKTHRTGILYTDALYDLTFSMDGRTALSSSLDGTLKLWDVTSGLEKCAWRSGGAHHLADFALALSPDGNMALTGGDDQMLHFWDLHKDFSLHAEDRSRSWIDCVAFSPDGQRALSGGLHGSLRLWDVASGTELRKFESCRLRGFIDPIPSFIGEIKCVAFSPDGCTALVGGSDQTLHLWDVHSGAEMHTFNFRSRNINSIVFSLDGNIALSSDDHGKLYLLDVRKDAWSDLRIWKGHTTGVESVALSTNGQLALSGDDKGVVRLWDIHGLRNRSWWSAISSFLPKWRWLAPRPIHTFRGHTACVKSVAFSPDALTALSGGYDGKLRLWDVNSGMKLREFVGHRNGVLIVAFCSAQIVLSVGWDSTLRLWDVQNGRCLSVLYVEQQISCCAIAPNGQHVMIGDKAGRVYFLRIVTERE